MLKVLIRGTDVFDEKTQKFLTKDDVEIVLEHSLFALSKWESIWEKPFLGLEDKTDEQTLSYITCMSEELLPPETLARLSKANIQEINEYISSTQTATTFNELQPVSRTRSIVTAEIVYYWMVSLNIPFECQYWHFNRLITLIKVINNKNAPPKKMGRRESAAQQRQLNAERRARNNTTG